MPRFFVNDIIGDTFLLDGENGRHASRSLRMKVGEKLTLCDGKGTDFFCEITEINSDEVSLRVNEKKENTAECPVKIYLYQCLPKADKMDLIVQKAVELGVYKIIPVISSRCITSYKGKEEKKIQRLNKISLEAAKQSGRGIVPEVSFPQSIVESVEKSCGKRILFYEKGGKSISEILETEEKEISVLIGPEGGFSEEEVEFARKNGFFIGTLGKRIVRTETAGLIAMSVLTYEVENKWKT
ncbi:MAG: 16S rRNA (uracil(1498)-N(3))-methyltransferase [Clostridia bacterium]